MIRKNHINQHKRFQTLRSKYSAKTSLIQYLNSKKNIIFLTCLVLSVISILSYTRTETVAPKDINHIFSDIDSSVYDTERNEKIRKRLEFLETKKEKGLRLSPPEEFDVRFLAFTRTKSRVSGEFSKDHCHFTSPKSPKKWSKKEEKKLMKELNISQKYLYNTNSEILSIEHEICTKTLPKTLEDSSLVFKDVCVTFNLDSLKQSQRGIIVFDNTNIDTKRCVPCPNPQLSKIWGETECGVMWLHQINSLPKINDFQTCYTKNKLNILQHGQRQRPGEIDVKGAVFYKGRTLLLQYVKINPGHQLWDFLSSIIPILQGKIEYKNTFSQADIGCNDSIWICNILRKFNLFKKNENENENLLKEFQNTLSCFEELITPIPGWNHGNDKLTKEQIKWLQINVQDKFGLNHFGKVVEFSKPNYKLLLYPHNTIGEAGKRRAWLDINETFEKLRKENDFLPKKVSDFAKLTVEEQSSLFYEADILFMSHGGQMANAIFCRENTIVVEITCGGYSQLGGNHGAFTEGLGLKHYVYKPCNCETGSQDGSNYFLSPEEIKKIVDFSTSLEKREFQGTSYLSGKKQLFC